MLTGIATEVERFIWAVRRHGRYGHRDATMILLAIGTGCASARVVADPFRERPVAVVGRAKLNRTVVEWTVQQR